MQKLHTVMATLVKENRNSVWLSAAQLEQLRVKCLAQERGQIQYFFFTGFYVLAQTMSYLFSLQWFFQLVKGFSHEQEADVTRPFQTVAVGVLQGRGAVPTNSRSCSISVLTCSHLIEAKRFREWGSGESKVNLLITGSLSATSK